MKMEGCKIYIYISRDPHLHFKRSYSTCALLAGIYHDYGHEKPTYIVTKSKQYKLYLNRTKMSNEKMNTY